MIKFFSDKKQNYIPDFDSSSSMLFSLGNYLADLDEAVGVLPKFPMKMGDAINKIPRRILTLLFRIGGAQESIDFKRLSKINDEIISNWITGAYPEKKYPGVLIGSPNGALIHLCAMLGIPWIPQTILLALNRKMDVDELIKDMEWGKKAAAIMKERLPDFRLHQMHDPIQDRVMVSRMGYFRVKRLKLGPYLEDYLRKVLMPEATILIANCGYRWPARKIDSQHYFQTGGLGDVGGYEYIKGSRRIANFLKKQGSSLRRWQAPEPCENIPEAEWGFAQELGESIDAFAKKNNYRQIEIRFGHPEDASPFCADLISGWYKKNGINDKRLLIECFALLVPWWAARTGSVPFWIAFNTLKSLKAVEGYLKTGGKYDEMYAIIMPNAVEGVGLAPIRSWKRVMKENSRRSALIGTDEAIYPHDMGTFIKYFKDLQAKIKARHLIPHSLEFRDFFAFLAKTRKKYNISFERTR